MGGTQWGDCSALQGTEQSYLEHLEQLQRVLSHYLEKVGGAGPGWAGPGWAGQREQPHPLSPLNTEHARQPDDANAVVGAGG